MFCRAYLAGPGTIQWLDIVGTPADPTDFALWNQQVIDVVRELLVEKITLLAVCGKPPLAGLVF